MLKIFRPASRDAGSAAILPNFTVDSSQYLDIGDLFESESHRSSEYANVLISDVLTGRDTS